MIPVYRSLSYNEPTTSLRHEGIRVGEIVAYRAWRVFQRTWFRKTDDRLDSVLVNNYVWHPDQPASGDIRKHGIYSFRNVIRSGGEYVYYPGTIGTLLFGKVKIWGEIVEHELGYRSQFAKIVSLDYGDPELLKRFRKIYRVNREGKEKEFPEPSSGFS